MRQRLVLEDLYDLLHTFDRLQVGTLLIPLPLVLELGGRNHLEDHTRMLARPNDGVGNAGGVAAFVLRCNAAANLRPAFGMAA